METLVINRKDITQLIELDELKKELIQGFISYSNGISRRDGQRIVLAVNGENTTTVLGPGTAPGIPAYTIKANSKFVNTKPAIKGVISLFDIQNGKLLALVDSSEVTAIRTGLCAALATDVLSDPQARHISIVGAGTQNLLQLQYLLTLRSFEKVSIFDPDQSRAGSFARPFENHVACTVAESLSDCLLNSDIILVATWSREPILDMGILPHYCHITSLGSDEKGKVEISKDVITGSKFYCDDIDLNVEMGTPGNLGLSHKHVQAEIGEVYDNSDKGRKKKQERTIYSCVGLPFQDLITAWHIYKKALKNGGVLRTKLF